MIKNAFSSDKLVLSGKNTTLIFFKKRFIHFLSKNLKITDIFTESFIVLRSKLVVQYLSDIYVVFYIVNYSVLMYKCNHLLLTRMKPSDFDYLKLIGKGSFGKVRILLYMHLNKDLCF